MSIGIDIGSYQTKVVELNQEKNSVRLKGYGIDTLLSNDIAYEPEKLTHTIIASNIRDLIKSNKFTVKNNFQRATILIF